MAKQHFVAVMAAKICTVVYLLAIDAVREPLRTLWQKVLCRERAASELSCALVAPRTFGDFATRIRRCEAFLLHYKLPSMEIQPYQASGQAIAVYAGDEITVEERQKRREEASSDSKTPCILFLESRQWSVTVHERTTPLAGREAGRKASAHCGRCT